MSGLCNTEAALFVSYASCLEEKEYCRFPSRVAPVLSEGCGEIGRAIIRCYEEIYRKPLMDELLNPTLLASGDFESVRQARATQLSLYVLALEVLRLRLSITRSAAFSAGYGPLFVAAGSLDPVDWLSKMYSAIREYSLNNVRIRSAGDLHTKLFCSYGSDDFSSFVVRAATEAGIDATLKDDREPYAVQLTGTNASLEQLARIVEATHPGFETTSTRVIRTDGAHIHPQRYREIKETLSLLNMALPKFEITTHTEGTLDRHAGTAPLPTVLFNALCAPLSMGRINRYLQAVSCPVIHLGSPRTARFAFYGFGPRRFSSPCFHWEDVLLSDETISPLSLPQDSPNW
jgi:hypothetical protein